MKNILLWFNKNICIQNLLTFFIYTVLFFIIFFFIRYLNSDVILNGDDIWNIPSCNIADSRYHHCFWFHINWLFVFYIPKKLGIHYNNWIAIYNFIRTGLFFLICFYISKFMNFDKKSRFYQFFAFFIIMIYLFKEIILFFQYSELTYTVARYIIPLFIMISAFYFVVKNIINFDGQNKKYTIFSSLFFLLLMFETEIFIVDSVLFLFFTSIISLIFYKKLISAVIFPIISVVIDLILYFSSGINLMAQKSYYVSQNIDIKAFLLSYKNHCVIEVFYSLLILLILFLVYFFILLKNKNDKNVKYYLFSVIFTALNFLSMCSLIKFDTEFYFNDNIKLIYDVLFFIPMFLLLNIETNYKKLLNFILLIIIASLISIHIYEYREFLGIIVKTKKEYCMERKKITYKYEKIFRLYSIKNIQPKIYVPDTEAIKIGIEKGKLYECYKGFYALYELMAQTYNIYNLKQYGFCLVSEKEAEQMYKSIGLKFGPDEIEKADFQRLKDDNFILNN